MSDEKPSSEAPLPPPKSPTGEPVIPPKYVPYVLALISIFVLLSAEFTLPGPWTPDRAFAVGAAILSILVGGSTVGLRR